MKIPYFLNDYDFNEYKAMIRVMNSGQMSMGREVDALESEFRVVDGCGYALAVNSATVGLYLASLCSPYKKAIVPSNTFIATYQAAYQSNHKIDIWDIGRYEKQNKRTTYNVHIGGSWESRFSSVVYGDFVIEDCAHCVPSGVGGGGDIWVYSFYANKNMSSPNGGMICTDNDEYYEFMKSLRNHGFMNRNGYKYNAKHSAFKFEMNDLTAAIVREQLKKLEWKQTERKRVYELYYKNLRDIVYMDTPDNHSYHLAIVEFPAEEIREKVEHKFQELEIGFSMHYRPLHIVCPELRKKKYDNYNHTKRYKRWLSLPIYPKLKSEDVEYICDVVRSVV